ncbi:MAG TPA: MltA domain-containing protein, partial [Burkholderiaceae bacterium]|nr:MltA domain-containing protein [Burkholderiaceae bacterium]
MSLKRLSLLVSVVLVGFGMAACTTVTPGKAPGEETVPKPVPPLVKPGEILRPVTFAALPEWGGDDLREAWPAFLASCNVLAKRDVWKAPCVAARSIDAKDLKALRAFFESFFTPYQVFNQDGSDTGLVTGYYEPLLRGARQRGGPYQTPLYRTPDDLLTIDLTGVYPALKGMRLRGRLVGNKIVPYLSRAELTHANVLAGTELLWVDDPVEAFFLQVQGSGRVRLMDTKETVRVAYAD